MGFLRSFINRDKVLKLAKKARLICGNNHLLMSSISQGVDPYEDIKKEFFSIINSYDSYDWRVLKMKHDITEEKLEKLWKELSTDEYVLHRTLNNPVYLPILVLDFSTAVEYILDFEDELSIVERNRIALQYTLQEISSLPHKPLS